ncbi:E3 ubiquitin-protein ligase TRIM21-like [Rana temporaria]|uniref:E3 ubiquitin-protein ligase TRIM21-like n=1 Tax=Rana temporaria TaxID=8407 RepID=UPI001AAD9FEA|nr:E3 ubiquitin-protein ligase TRIM21-like [Rana temporaria]
MASADLRAELKCAVCLKIYTNPVMLKCGHNFCWDCISRVLDTQEESGDYVCPVCRKGSRSRPELHRNITLHNIVAHFLSAQPDQESGVFCTHCVDSPVLAVRSCLHCEVSMCNKHVRVHKKSPEHILCAPILSMERHTGHKVVSLNEACGKKELLRNVLKKLLTKREEMEERVQSLQEHRRKVEEAAGDTERVRHQKDLEKRVLEDISEAADLLLDVNTVFKYLHISDDKKTVSGSELYQYYPETPERFQYCPQVMSIQSFSSGRHYWEVKVGGSQNWIVGMCYPSIDRGELLLSEIGEDNKSWGLYRGNDHYWVAHNSDEIPLSANLSSNRVGIYLDYEAGRISFYDMCDPIRHIHTYTTTFTEPLHAVLGVWLYKDMWGGIMRCDNSTQSLVTSETGSGIGLLFNQCF